VLLQNQQIPLFVPVVLQNRHFPLLVLAFALALWKLVSVETAFLSQIFSDTLADKGCRL